MVALVGRSTNHNNVGEDFVSSPLEQILYTLPRDGEGLADEVNVDQLHFKMVA